MIWLWWCGDLTTPRCAGAPSGCAIDTLADVEIDTPPPGCPHLHGSGVAPAGTHGAFQP